MNNNEYEEIDYENIPHQFLCPISLEIMKDPVICQDGHTYERKSILAINKNTSPMTRLPIDKNIIIDNINIRQLIEEFIKSKQIKYKIQLYKLEQKEQEEELKYKTQLYEIKQKKQELIIKEQLYELKKKEYELEIKKNTLNKSTLVSKLYPEPELIESTLVSKLYPETELIESTLVSELYPEPELIEQYFLEQAQILNCAKQEIIEQTMTFSLIGKKIMIYGLISTNGKKLNNKIGIIKFKHTFLYSVELLENTEECNNKPILLKIENIKLII